MNSKELKILKTATALFSRYGYHSVGIDRIISEAGVAKMTFYKHFPSKKKLIERTLSYRDQQLRTDIIASVSKAKSPHGKLKSIFDWYDSWFASSDFYGCMFIKASEEFPELESGAKKISQAHKTWLAKQIEVILIEIGSNHPKKLAQHVVHVLDGLTINHNLFGSGAALQTKEAWKYVKILSYPQ